MFCYNICMKTPDNQLDMFKAPLPNTDSQGRSLEEVKKATKSLNQEILDSITLKGGEYYIDDVQIDKWIELNDKFYEESNSDMYRHN